MGALALKDDALGHNDAGPAALVEVAHDVIHKQHFGAFAPAEKAAMRSDAAFGRHERGVGEDDVVVVVPAFFAGQGVVHADAGLLLVVQEQVDGGQHLHGGGDVVAHQVAGQVPPVSGGETAAPLDVLPGRG